MATYYPIFCGTCRVQVGRMGPTGLDFPNNPHCPAGHVTEPHTYCSGCRAFLYLGDLFVERFRHVNGLPYCLACANRIDPRPTGPTAIVVGSAPTPPTISQSAATAPGPSSMPVPSMPPPPPPPPTAAQAARAWLESNLRAESDAWAAASLVGTVGAGAHRAQVEALLGALPGYSDAATVRLARQRGWR